MRRRLIALGALAIAILGIGIAVAASGGTSSDSGGDETAGTTGPTGDTGGTGATGELGQFIDDADAICSDTQVEVAGLAAGSESDDPSAEDVATEAGLIDAQLSQIGRLDQPRENRDTLQDYLNSLDAQGQALGDLELGLGNGDDATIETAQADVESSRADAQRAAEEYGFGDCAEGDSAALEAADVGADTAAVVPTTPTTTPTDLGEAVEQATTPETVPVEPPPEEVVPEEPAPTEPDTGTGGGGIGTGGTGGTSGGGSGTGSGGISP